MSFRSIEFVLLLAIVLPLYFLLRARGRQNVLLLVASYVFYGWWDARFLGLLAASTLTDYLVGMRLERETAPRRRKALLGVSCVVNLGLLGTFKYWDLFAATGNGLGAWLGIEHAILPELHLVLPVGISFYTFQTLAYSVDVYRGRQEACRNLLDFALYVSFFPQLVAGPIERPARLLPQIRSERRVTAHDIEEGVFLIASGWFRKSLGDVMGGVADPVFARGSLASPADLLWGAYAFAFQIYLDFSGYTDIARGAARLFGIRLMVNFRAPYFAANVREFWRRWHISLSTWLRDYLYIPLGGSRRPGAATYRNLMLTMLLGGLWHGAGWNFAVWGLLHGTYLAVQRAVRPRAPADPARKTWLPSRFAGALVTFHLVLIGWIFFRADPLAGHGAVEMAWKYLVRLADLRPAGLTAPPPAFWMLSVVLACDVAMERAGDAFFARRWPWILRGLTMAALILLGLILGSGENRAFIYFQF